MATLILIALIACAYLLINRGIPASDINLSMITGLNGKSANTTLSANTTPSAENESDTSGENPKEKSADEVLKELLAQPSEITIIDIGSGDADGKLAENGTATAFAEEKLREQRLEDLVAQGFHKIDQADPDTITLRFAGDILFDESYAIMATMLQRSGGGFPDITAAFDGELMSLMRGADIFMINNEFPYSKRGAKVTKTYNFRARPEYASLMNTIGADAVSLANNHVNDYGPDAMEDTFLALEGAGVPYVGAGRNLEEASKPIYFTNGDVKIAIIAATQIERELPAATVGATETSAGVFRCTYDMSLLVSRIVEAKEAGYFTICYIHWGTEGTENIDDWQLKQGKQIANAGADIIIGDHPHVLQRLDWLKNENTGADVPVIYSLGNYLFNSKTLDTCLYELTLDAKDSSIKEIKFIPAIQSGCRTKIASGDDYARIIKKMNAMSPNVNINDDGTISIR